MFDSLTINATLRNQFPREVRAPVVAKNAETRSRRSLSLGHWTGFLVYGQANQVPALGKQDLDPYTLLDIAGRRTTLHLSKSSPKRSAERTTQKQRCLS